MSGIWSVGGNLGTARGGLAAAGSQTAGLCFGGTSSSVVTEEYDGSAWGSGGDLSTGRSLISGAGTQTAAISPGGYISSASAVTEEYDGSSWSGGGALSAAQQELAACGTLTAGLSFGGYIGSAASVVTSEYDGTSWTSGGDLATARMDLSGCGVQTAGLSVGGWTGANTSNVCEEYNGTAWGSGGALSVARYGTGSAGSQTEGLCFGGVNEAGTRVTLTEAYNGTAWSTSGVGSLGTARSSSNGGCGTQAAGLSMGGTIAGGDVSAITEEYIQTPTVTTQAVTSITSTSGVGNGNITSIGGANATRRGFAYYAKPKLENFTTFTEVDEDGDYTITSTKIDISSLRGDAVSYVYKDMGANFFSGDFTHKLEVFVNSGSSDGQSTKLWAVSNDIGTYSSLTTGSKSFLALRADREGTQSLIRIIEVDSGTAYTDQWIGGDDDTLYYLTITRDEATGTYGTIYCYIYSDSGRTTLVDTLSVALHTSKKDFRYIYGAMSRGTTGESDYFTGYVQNLDLNLDPTIADSVVYDDGDFGTGAFTHVIGV